MSKKPRASFLHLGKYPRVAITFDQKTLDAINKRAAMTNQSFAAVVRMCVKGSLNVDQNA